MSGFFGSDFNPAVPADTDDISNGASWIRDIKQRIKTFEGVLFNLETGELNSGVVPQSALANVSGLTAGTYSGAVTIAVAANGTITSLTEGSSGEYKTAGAVEQPATGGTGQNIAPTAGQILVGTSGGVFALTTLAPVSQGGISVNSTSGAITLAIDPTFFPAIPFYVSVTLTSAAAATPIQLISNFSSTVLAGRSIYVTGFCAHVDGSTSWGTTSTITLADNANANTFAQIATSALTGSATLFLSTAGVTLGNPIVRGTGGQASSGIQVFGNVNGTGSNLILTVWGFYK